MARSSLTYILLILLAAWIHPSMAAGLDSGNFARDFIIALAIAASATVVFTILICVCAQCGPQLFGFTPGRERWFNSSKETSMDEEKNFLFVQSTQALTHPPPPAYK